MIINKSIYISVKTKYGNVSGSGTSDEDFDTESSSEEEEEENVNHNFVCLEKFYVYYYLTMFILYRN